MTPDGGPVIFNPNAQALMGHSMGGTISPLALAFEPRFRAGILSGEGGSWIENILYKLEPLDVAPAIEILIGYTNLHRTLTAGDPVLCRPRTTRKRARSRPRSAAIGNQPC